MTDLLLNSIGQGLLSIGLYGVAFESMVLTCRDQMHGYLSKSNPALLQTFLNKHCGTSNATLLFCEPLIVQLGIINLSDMQDLVAIRLRRNHMAHQGYDEALTLTVKDIEDDVLHMVSVSRKLEGWRQAVSKKNPDGNTSFKIAPSIFSLYLEAARELAETKLKVSNQGASGASQVAPSK